MDEVTLFRPVKRRKFVRHHAQEDDQPSDSTDRPSPQDGTTSEPDKADVDVSSILKMRRQGRNRAGGVQFTANTASAMVRSSESNALTTVASPPDTLSAISDRFVGHTGEVVDVDKHMMAYIDSEMAKRRTAQQETSYTPSVEATSSNEQADKKLAAPTTRQPASLGQLQEIPVTTQPPPTPKPARQRKPRLDRFGRPLKPRPPRQRHDPSSLARDQLVDAILEETRPDTVYDQPASTLKSTNHSDTLVTDETMAAQFQRDFMDALQVRRQQQQMQQQQQQGKKMPGGGDTAAQKGPKLGGSRSARAAMMLAREKEKEKK